MNWTIATPIIALIVMAGFSFMSVAKSKNNKRRSECETDFKEVNTRLNKSEVNMAKSEKDTENLKETISEIKADVKRTNKVVNSISKSVNKLHINVSAFLKSAGVTEINFAKPDDE